MLAVAVGLLVAFGIGETVCRIAGLDGLPDIDPTVLEQRRKARESSIFRRSDDPLLIYELRPDYSVNGLRLTESGGILRETDVPVVKPAGAFRIVVLGDSISAMIGQRIHLGARPWPDALEVLLNGPVPRADRVVEVLNFGTDGYGTLQEARLLETKAVRYDPDLILVQYCYNDPGMNVTPAAWFLDEGKPLSYLVGFVTSKLRGDPALDLVPNIGPVTPEARRHWEALYEPASASWGRVVNGFARIAAVASKRDAPVVLVAFPMLLLPEQRSAALSVIRGQVFDEARRHGFTIVDLRPAFSRFPPRVLKEFPDGDPYHPNARGHAIAARVVADGVAGLLTIR
jgi:lysophospholipase L1-like esterase